jgi:hypothetical protein
MKRTQHTTGTMLLLSLLLTMLTGGGKKESENEKAELEINDFSQ